MNAIQVGLIMGSQSDWKTMKKSAEILDVLEIQYETRIISAHRTPNRLFEYAGNIVSEGIKVIIAGAGGAAHLPGMIASKTSVPVIGVPMKTEFLSGLDSLYSIVQMPKGYPVATMAIGDTGAINAALYAASIISISDQHIRKNLKKWKSDLSNSIPLKPKDD